MKHSGLRHVTLHNCTLGDNVLIENVQNYIANYRIGDDCFYPEYKCYVGGRQGYVRE